MAFLASQGHTIIDLTNDELAQKQGIDFMVGDRYVEFKSDSKIHQTGNLAYEIVSNSRKATPGCCLYSEADYLLYYDSVNLVCHKMRFPELKLAIENSKQTIWKVAKTANPAQYSDGLLFCGFSLLVPLSFIKSCPEIGYQAFSVAEFAATYLAKAS
jgi:hypothetical protein